MASMDPLMVGPPPPGGPFGGSGSSPPSRPRPDILVSVNCPLISVRTRNTQHVTCSEVLSDPEANSFCERKVTRRTFEP